MGIPAGVPEDGHHVITFKDLGDPSTGLRVGRTEMTMTEQGYTRSGHDYPKPVWSSASIDGCQLCQKKAVK
jgi:hypothetical protein